MRSTFIVWLMETNWSQSYNLKITAYYFGSSLKCWAIIITFFNQEISYLVIGDSQCQTPIVISRGRTATNGGGGFLQRSGALRIYFISVNWGCLHQECDCRQNNSTLVSAG